LKNGNRSRFICCQDESGKKAKKVDPNKKSRDNVGFTRYPCGSHLQVRVLHAFMRISVRLEVHHEAKHLPYFDITMPPKAHAIILQNLWTTPSVIATEVQRRFPDVTTNQIYHAWKTASEGLWKKKEDQMLSAVELLKEYDEDVDVFTIDPIEGVMALAWGLKSVATCITDVVEVAMDATCK
jgi:hypothetical protein